VKIETPVNFPLSLNMLPYHSQARGTDIKDQYEKARSCTYDLLSVVEHKGEIDTGHYVTYSRVGDQVSHILHHPWYRPHPVLVPTDPS
jgi:ubiquitin carboxyl-terminal hydrolase 22/27/51